MPSKATSRRDNPIVFLDISVDKKFHGRLIIELRADVVPKTAENFRILCRGDATHPQTGKKLTFHGSPVHRIVTDSLLQAGDIDGNGGHSAYHTRFFEDENFILRHVGMGTLSMVNSGPDTNGSQFFITFTSAPWFDNKHVVFGALLGESSYETLASLHRIAATESGQPARQVVISDSGQLHPS